MSNPSVTPYSGNMGAIYSKNPLGDRSNAGEGRSPDFKDVDWTVIPKRDDDVVQQLPRLTINTDETLDDIEDFVDRLQGEDVEPQIHIFSGNLPEDLVKKIELAVVGQGLIAPS